MALAEPASITTLDAVRDLARQIDASAHGAKSSLIENFANGYGWSKQKVYRQLQKVGWQSGRKKRIDCGDTEQSEEALQKLSATLGLGIRKNGKATMFTPNARSMLAQNGVEFNVSNSRLNTLLKQRQMDLKTQRTPKAHQPMRSLHPNHVHQVDPSLCLLYYLPGGGQKFIRDDEAYKNKPEAINKVGSLKVWRYVLTDHYSGALYVHYYQAAGETQTNLYDFLLHAWQQQQEKILHGVPQILLWDKGSANTSKGICNALDALDVKHIPHAAGNPRAKGQVEVANNLVETLFESRLLYEPVANVDELNRAARAWCEAFNANAIPNYDSRIKRRFLREPKSRYGLWQTIQQNQLRLLPDLEVCKHLLTNDPVIRKVKPDLTVTFRHPKTKQSEAYLVADLPGVYPNAEVLVSPLIYSGTAQVIVSIEDYKGEVNKIVLDPVAADQAGFAVYAPVIGAEHKAQKDTVADDAKKSAQRLAFPDRSDDDIKKAIDKREAPLGGLDAHSHLHHVYKPEFIQRPGSELHVPETAQVVVQPLSLVQALKVLRGRLNRPLTTHENQYIQEQYPGGVPDAEINSVVEYFTNPQPQTKVANLSVIK